jgi:hypothetical protein
MLFWRYQKTKQRNERIIEKHKGIIILRKRNKNKFELE